MKEFAAELKHLTIHCDFAAHLDEALRDHFVCELKNETIQKWLLTERELTFAGSIDIAHGMESAANNVRKLQGAQPSNDIHKLTPAQGEAKECYRCGQHNHKPAHCPYRGSKCYGCGKIGHLKRKCRHQQQQLQQPPRLPRQPPGQPVRTVTDKSETSLSLYNISDKSVKPFTVKVKLNDKPLSMELDTGATVSLISSKTFQQLFPGVTVKPTATQLQSY